MTSCSSSVSALKSTKPEDHRSNSCDTVCTSNSSCYLQRRIPMNPLMYSVRPGYSKSSGNSIRQRVLSAKLLKVRTIQNQLNDANYHLSELSKENQVLKNLQIRQEKALSKYENTNADLPRLLHCHEEQMRALTEKSKSQRKTIKELNEILRVKEDELAKSTEKLNHLEKLNKDKRLLDREKMLDEIEDLSLKLKKADEQVTLLNRKLLLESKTSKHRLNAEIVKHKQCQKDLAQAILQIDRLTGLLEAKQNEVHPRKNRFSRFTQNQSISMITLRQHYQKRSHSTDKLYTADSSEAVISKTPVTDVKLEPIKCKKEGKSRKTNGILNMPLESIKNRLSGGSTRSRLSDESSIINESKEQSTGSELTADHIESSSGTRSPHSSDINDKLTSQSYLDNQLEKLTSTLDAAIQRDEFHNKLGSCCSDIINNVRNCAERIEAHKSSLKMSSEDTDSLMETFKNTQILDSKFTNSLPNESNNMDFMKNSLAEEMSRQMNKSNKDDDDGNLTKREPAVKMEDRKKLLATLKAIDNGDSIDSLSDSPLHKASNLMQGIITNGSKW